MNIIFSDDNTIKISQINEEIIISSSLLSSILREELVNQDIILNIRSDIFLFISKIVKILYNDYLSSIPKYINKDDIENIKKIIKQNFNYLEGIYKDFDNRADISEINKSIKYLGLTNFEIFTQIFYTIWADNIPKNNKNKLKQLIKNIN